MCRPVCGRDTDGGDPAPEIISTSDGVRAWDQPATVQAIERMVEIMGRRFPD
jgi:hypothetical protein